MPHVSLAVQLPSILEPGGLSFTDEERGKIAGQAGARVRQAVRDNFTSREGRTYWMTAADRTSMQVLPDGSALVTVDWRGVHLRWRGGVVKPKPGNKSSKTGRQVKLLSIPLGASGKRPGDLGPLAFLPIRKKPKLRGYLVPGEPGKAKRKYKGKPAGRAIVRPKAGAPPAFALVTHTVHQPDETVIPTPEKLHGEATKGAAFAVRMITKQRNKNK